MTNEIYLELLCGEKKTDFRNVNNMGWALPISFVVLLSSSLIKKNAEKNVLLIYINYIMYFTHSPRQFLSAQCGPGKTKCWTPMNWYVFKCLISSVVGSLMPVDRNWREEKKKKSIISLVFLWASDFLLEWSIMFHIICGGILARRRYDLLSHSKGSFSLSQHWKKCGHHR